MFVVLPFENLSGDPAQEYIADGMTEEMIAQMGSLDPQRIGVIARTSAMHFKGTPLSAAEIGRNLGVGYLLEGSVRHVGDRVRVTAQLIKASDQTHLWAANYDSDFGDLLQLESNIAGAIAAQVQVKLDADSAEDSLLLCDPQLRLPIFAAWKTGTCEPTVPSRTRSRSFNKPLRRTPITHCRMPPWRGATSSDPSSAWAIPSRQCHARGSCPLVRWS
jgi:TolB-like protein